MSDIHIKEPTTEAGAQGQAATQTPDAAAQPSHEPEVTPDSAETPEDPYKKFTSTVQGIFQKLFAKHEELDNKFTALQDAYAKLQEEKSAQPEAPAATPKKAPVMSDEVRRALEEQKKINQQLQDQLKHKDEEAKAESLNARLTESINSSGGIAKLLKPYLINKVVEEEGVLYVLNDQGAKELNPDNFEPHTVDSYLKVLKADRDMSGCFKSTSKPGLNVTAPKSDPLPKSRREMGLTEKAEFIQKNGLPAWIKKISDERSVKN